MTHDDYAPPLLDENAQHLDAWTADPERDRSDFSASTRPLAEDPPSSLPEYLILSALAGVCAVLVYFALKVML